MADVTIIILTKNEEVNLHDCLKSVQSFAKRIVVVDSGSSDKTQKNLEQMFILINLKIMQDNLIGQ